MTTKKRTRRQARWAEFLAGYNFQVTYRPGKQNDKADALTRRLGDRPEGDEQDDRQQYQLQTLLPASRIHPDVGPISLAPIHAQKEDPVRIPRPGPLNPRAEDLTILEQIRISQGTDTLCIETLAKLRNQDRTSQDVALIYCEEVDGLMQYKNKIWILEDIRVPLLQEVHDKPATGHPGIGKMLRILKDRYYWPRMDRTVQRYVQNCHICRCSKPSRETYNGLLQPLPIP